MQSLLYAGDVDISDGDGVVAVAASCKRAHSPGHAATHLVVRHSAAVHVSSLTPMLTVRKAADAIDFYRRAFGAIERSRLTTPTGQVVAELSVAGFGIFVVDENPDALNMSPESLGGTTIRLNLIVDDPDSVAIAAVAAGATELFPVADQPYGLRQGRIIDPSGHHWLIGTPLDT
jgi:PhnB protein